MNSRIKKYLIPILSAAAALFLGPAPVYSPQEWFIHRVVAGESISLICIDYYGYYSEALGKAVMAANPFIKNIDLIYPGQELTLRKPGDPAKKEVGSFSAADTISGKAPAARQTAVEASGDTLFVKKMGITQGVVTCVEGTVHLRINASSKPQPLKINTVVFPGNVIETGADGRVEIVINREAVVRLREKTKMSLEAFRTAAAVSGKTRVGCSLGSVWSKVKKFKDRISRFELELPKAIAGVYGTVYESTASPDSSAEIKVFSGEVSVSGAASAQKQQPLSGSAPSEVPGPHEVAPPQEVTMERWTQIVREMQKITIDRKGSPSSPVSFTKNSADGWERWNNERDVRIAELFGEREK